MIRSCGKLTYPIVQTMIEGSFDPKRHDKATRDRVEGSSVDKEEEGKYYNVHSDGSISPHGIVDVGVSNPAKVVEVHGGYSWASVMDDSLLLWKVAKRLRKARRVLGLHLMMPSPLPHTFPHTFPHTCSGLILGLSVLTM